MANGQTVRCWPQYQGNQGIKHNWVLVRFEVDEDNAIPSKGAGNV
jgi:hypothetical protein